MLHTAIALVIFPHGVGHVVGFWMPVPTWFALVWLLPGAGFLVGAWSFWQRADWWPVALVGSATASLLMLALPTGALRQSGFGSAFVFNVLVILALLAPWSRRLAAGL